MSKRNMIWLAVVVAVGLAFGITVGIGWGFLAAGIVLVISEIVERTARARRRTASGDAMPPKMGEVINSRRRSK